MENVMPKFKDDKEYHAYPAVSQSAIKQFKKSPVKFWKETPLNPNRKPKEATKAMNNGTLFHHIVMDQPDFDDIFAVEDWDLADGSRNTNVYKAWKKEFLEKSIGKIIVTQDEIDLAYRMKEALYKNPFIKDLLSGAYCEKPLVWDENGIRMKVKFDWLKKNKNEQYIYIDYKTTGKFKNDPHQETREDWLIQSVSTRKGLKAVHGKNLDKCIFILQSTDEPDIVEHFELLNSEMDVAEIEFDCILENIAHRVEIMRNAKTPEEQDSAWLHSLRKTPRVLQSYPQYLNRWIAYSEWKVNNPEGTYQEFVDQTLFYN